MTTTEKLAQALSACLIKGSRWHPCDPTVMQARAALATWGAEKASEQQAERLSDAQIEALPVWKPFLGLQPEHRLEITRAIEHAIGPKRHPLTEEQLVKCLVEAHCVGIIKMSFESGPYEVTRPSINADRLVRAIERVHGIGVKLSSQEGTLP